MSAPSRPSPESPEEKDNASGVFGTLSQWDYSLPSLPTPPTIPPALLSDFTNPWPDYIPLESPSVNQPIQENHMQIDRIYITPLLIDDVVGEIRKTLQWRQDQGMITKDQLTFDATTTLERTLAKYYCFPTFMTPSQGFEYFIKRTKRRPAKIRGKGPDNRFLAPRAPTATGPSIQAKGKAPVIDYQLHSSEGSS